MNKPVLTAALALAAAVPLPPVAAPAQQIVETNGQPLRLAAGQGRLIRLNRPAASVFIADAGVADVHVRSPTLIYVMAKAPGATTLYAIDSAERVILGTEISVGFDETRLTQLIRQHSPGSNVTVSSLDDALVLSGEVPSAAEGEEILRIASRFIDTDEEDLDSWLINRLTVTAPNQINLRVRVAEVSREASRSLGFNWSSLADLGDVVLGLATGAPIRNAAGDVIRPADGSGAIFAGLDTEDARVDVLIDALARRGLITILAEPNLTARSGEPASFLAGGEYPIPVPQGPDQITIEYKRFGVSLAFVATILDRDRISLNVRPEVSQLSNAGAITLNDVTVPALTTRRAETTVELASGQSFAIAGLLQNSTIRDVDRIPGLGDIPIIGRLFRSERFQQNRSELVIIVTPYLVRPVSQPLPTPIDLIDQATPSAAPQATQAEPPAASYPAEGRP